MEPSILISTKKVLGLAQDYEVFDLDVITYINSAFFNLNQLGLGPDEGFQIEDETAVWDDVGLPSIETGVLKTYIFLKVRMLFDPPTTSYLIEAMNKQIQEHEWRMNTQRELRKHPLEEVNP